MQRRHCAVEEVAISEEFEFDVVDFSHFNSNDSIHLPPSSLWVNFGEDRWEIILADSNYRLKIRRYFQLPAHLGLREKTSHIVAELTLDFPDHEASACALAICRPDQTMERQDYRTRTGKPWRHPQQIVKLLRSFGGAC